MKLNKKHNIPFLSVWKHKDGGLYKALKVIQASPNGSNKIDLVWYLQTFEQKAYKVRPATKEEVLSLVIKI